VPVVIGLAPVAACARAGQVLQAVGVTDWKPPFPPTTAEPTVMQRLTGNPVLICQQLMAA
jgi:hypothetical protein